jgi:hypothetical protein
MKVDRKDHDSERKHPKAQNREKPQHPADQQANAQQDPQGPRSREPNGMIAETQPMTFGSGLVHHCLKSVRNHPN